MANFCKALYFKLHSVFVSVSVSKNSTRQNGKFLWHLMVVLSYVTEKFSVKFSLSLFLCLQTVHFQNHVSDALCRYLLFRGLYRDSSTSWKFEREYCQIYEAFPRCSTIPRYTIPRCELRKFSPRAVELPLRRKFRAGVPFAAGPLLSYRSKIRV